ncbi:hypothetical protein EAC41_10910 [Enterococcus faecium]|nr:hypothetical protein [Enterococcus faecium]
MKKWLFGFLGVTLIVFCSVFGYVSYQKHEGEVFKQNIEKKMPVDQINAHAKSYKEDATNVKEDTGRTLHLKDAAFIEDPQHNQVILKGKSYGKEIQTALPSEEFALGNPFRFSLETVSEVAKRKNEIYHEQQLSQKERV